MSQSEIGEGADRDELISYYSAFDESVRLNASQGKLEKARTEELLLRFLPAPPSRVFDVGGAAGTYSRWLAAKGYEVHLIDPVPRHIETAKHSPENDPSSPIASFNVGDARSLPALDSSVDVILCFGPLYHLWDYSDRILALQESRRALRPGGVIFATGISRMASLLAGMIGGFLEDPVFRKIVEEDLATGQHRNPTNNPDYFTSAYFHHPSELRAEFEAAGLHHDATIAIEGPGWLLPDLGERMDNATRRTVLLESLSRIETEPSAIGVTGHLMAVGYRPQSE